MSAESLPTSTLTRLFAIRYLYASSLILILWDALVTFDDEFQVIWSRKFSITTALYFLNRYGVAAIQITFQYVSSGISTGLDLKTCQTVIPFMLTTTLLSSALTNGYMAFYYLALWDRNKRALTALTAMYIVTYIPASIMCIKSVVDSHSLIRYAAEVNECFTTQQPNLMMGFWAFLVWFDLCALFVVVLNALNRPHRRTLDAWKALQEDGFTWFGALFVLRLVNLVCIVRLPPEDAFLHLFHIWAAICILLSRFIFRVEKSKHARATVYLWNTSNEAFQLRGMGDQ